VRLAAGKSDMISKGRKKATVRFAIRPADGARKVCLAGDFTNWQPVAMQKRKDGTFVRNLGIGQETFEYKFMVDGEWVTDPDNHFWALNAYGTFNSVGRLE
jgi:1,4-alpha-glucan branching enzyme